MGYPGKDVGGELQIMPESDKEKLSIALNFTIRRRYLFWDDPKSYRPMQVKVIYDNILRENRQQKQARLFFLLLGFAIETVYNTPAKYALPQGFLQYEPPCEYSCQTRTSASVLWSQV
jgi:hypothetical protein